MRGGLLSNNNFSSSTTTSIIVDKLILDVRTYVQFSTYYVRTTLSHFKLCQLHVTCYGLL